MEFLGLLLHPDQHKAMELYTCLADSGIAKLLTWHDLFELELVERHRKNHGLNHIIISILDVKIEAEAGGYIKSLRGQLTTQHDIGNCTAAFSFISK